VSTLFIISGPSGCGKSTLVGLLRRSLTDLDYSISYTTRPPRGNERNGREYYFISREEFERMIAAQEFLECADVFGNYYGTVRRLLRVAEDRDLLLDIDVQGAEQIKKIIPEAVSIFILPPSRENLERRLRNRGLDTEDVIRRRLFTTSREIENSQKYDHVLVNDRLEKCADELRAIVLSERRQRSGRPLPGQGH